MDRGSVVADRFVIEAHAGSGGMATVWRALDRSTGERVAIKVLGPRRDEREAERFVREAEILADARHPAIVRYVAHGSAEGAPWLAMEWLEGEDLGERLEREPLTMAQTFTLIGRAAEALGFAHKRGIVHRDVKPSNLFLVERDIERVKLLDFGIARLKQSTRTTHSRTTLGTPGYMAPEQARGDPLVDARADVFSLGCVMFECLTGRAAFLGEHVLAVLAKILLEEVPTLGQMQLDAPPALTDLVARMMAKEAAGRPADGAAVATALAGIDLGATDWAPRPVTQATELTAREQRLLSVVLARTTPETDELARTMPDRDAGPRVAALRDKLKPTGAQLEPLADGTLIATVGVGGAAGRDQRPGRRARR